MLSRQEKEIFMKVIIIIQIFIPFIGIISHVLLLYAFYKDPLKCLKKLGTAFVINLAISDFLACLTMLLQASIFLAADNNENHSLPVFFSILFVNVSCLNISSISVDRLLLIVYPIKHRYWIKKKVIAVWISFIWFVCISYSLKRLIFGIEKNFEDLLYGSLAAVLFSSTSIVYAFVYKALKNKLKYRTELNEGSEHRPGDDALRLLKEKKFLKTIIVIALITFASYCPWWTLVYVWPENVLARDSLGYWMLLTIYKTFFLINFAINPLIYFLRFLNYQKTFRILYCRK